MTQEILEILIGKYLDNEITGGEQCVLDAELKNDPKARELLEQLQDLHERSRCVVAAGILEQGQAPEEIFEQAWQRQTNQSTKRLIKRKTPVRFAVGVAVGLVIGLILHFVLTVIPKQQTNHEPQNILVQEPDSRTDADMTNPQLVFQNTPGNITRNVDWYSFTDRNGDRWLIEGLRENTIRPAVNNSGL